MQKIHDYQYFMTPVLEVLSNHELLSVKEIYQRVISKENFTDEQLSAKLPSGRSIIVDRLHWALTYLRKARLIESPDRALAKITQRGVEALKSGVIVNTKYLEQFEEFREFKKRSNPKSDFKEKTATKTPEQLMAEGSAALQAILIDELKQKINNCTPDFFEDLVVKLLLAMGYGGSLEDAGKALGRSGDGGVDGVIKEDKLGLDVMYIQAKKWEGSVGRDRVQAFAGSLEGFQANKGVLITTSGFSKDAVEYCKRIQKRIVLIDGEELAKLMIEHNIGVLPVAKYEVKQINADFFEESLS